MLRICQSEERLPSDEEFAANRPAYKEALKEASELAGEEPLDDIGEWAVEWTQETGELPTPEQFRAQTRKFLADRDIEIPAGSVLREA